MAAEQALARGGRRGVRVSLAGGDGHATGWRCASRKRRARPTGSCGCSEAAGRATLRAMRSRGPRLRLRLAALLAVACLLPANGTGGGAARVVSAAPGAASADRLEPLVDCRRASVGPTGALPIAAVFPTLGRYAVSGLQSLCGARSRSRTSTARAASAAGRCGWPSTAPAATSSTPAQAAALAARAGVLAIVGANSSELSLAVAEEAERARHPADDERLDGLRPDLGPERAAACRPFVFRMCASDDVIGELLAAFARDRLGARRVAILYEVGRSYSAQLARSFRRRFDEPAAGRVTVGVLLPRARDRLPPAAAADQGAAARRGLHARLVPGRDAGRRAGARRWGCAATFLGGDAWSSPLLFQRGAPPGEAYYVELCSPAPEFDRQYAESAGSEPPGCRAVLAYDAVRVIAAGLARLGPLSEEDLGDGLAADAAPAARRRGARARPRASPGASASTSAATAARAWRCTRSRARRWGRAPSCAAGWASRERAAACAARRQPAPQGDADARAACSPPA